MLLVACAGCAASSREARREARQLVAQAEETVLRSLGSRDADERLRATRLVVELRDPRLDPVLPERLVDPDARVRAQAAVALAGHAAARQVLVAALAGDDVEARRIATSAVLATADATPWLERLAADPSPSVRAELAAVLAGGKPGDLAPALLERLVSDADPSVRAAAVRAWAAAGGRRGREVVARALDDAALPVRLAALAALRDAAPEPRLLALGGGADRYLALRAAVQLSRRGRVEPALAAVQRAAEDARPEVRVAAMNAAGELGAAAVEVARARLVDPELEVRLAATRALVTLGHAEEARPLLRTALTSPRALDAADALARLGDAQGRAFLEAALASADVQPRRQALALLAPLPGAQPLIGRALSDRDATVRLLAAETLLRRAFR